MARVTKVVNTSPLSRYLRSRIGQVWTMRDCRAAAKYARQFIHIDEDTGLFDAKYFQKVLFPQRIREWSSERRGHRDRRSRWSCLLFTDGVSFGAINDTFGQTVGDKVIKELAISVRDSVRSQDIVARAGGDENWILLSDLDHPGDADDCVDRIDRKIQGTQWNLIHPPLSRFPNPPISLRYMVLAIKQNPVWGVRESRDVARLCVDLAANLLKSLKESKDHLLLKAVEYNPELHSLDEIPLDNLPERRKLHFKMA